MLSASRQEERLMSVHASIPDLEANRRLVGRYFDFLNEGDPSIAKEALSPSVMFFGPRAPEGIHGREAFIDFVSSLRRDAPDIHFAEGEMVAEGNLVASRYTFMRTHSTEEGAAKEIATEGMHLFRIGDKVIEEMHSYFDRLSLLVEMGVISPPPQP
jgi:predicted SnoaL-like aldol condensation-catalyzing enzyme